MQMGTTAGDGKLSWAEARRVASTLSACEAVAHRCQGRTGFNSRRYRAVCSPALPAEHSDWQLFQHRGKPRLLIRTTALCRWTGVTSPTLAGVFVASRLVSPGDRSRLRYGGSARWDAAHDGKFYLFEVDAAEVDLRLRGGGSLQVAVHESLVRALCARDKELNSGRPESGRPESGRPISGRASLGRPGSGRQVAVRVVAQLFLPLAGEGSPPRAGDLIAAGAGTAALRLRLGQGEENIERWLRMELRNGRESSAGRTVRWLGGALRENVEMNEVQCRVLLGEISLPLDAFLSLKEGVSLELPPCDELSVVFEVGTTSIGRGRLTIHEGAVAVRIDEMLTLP